MLHANVGRPAFEQLKLVGATIAQVAWLVVSQRPNYFDLDGLMGYFPSEVSRRMMDDKELPSCSQYRCARMPRERAGANPNETVGFPGPLMTASGRRISGDTAFKTDDGDRIWWGYNSHLGRAADSFARARVFCGNYDALTTAAKIAIWGKFRL